MEVNGLLSWLAVIATSLANVGTAIQASTQVHMPGFTEDTRCFFPMGHSLVQPSVFLHGQSLVMAVSAEPESVEDVLPCTHVSNATEQQASSLSNKLRTSYRGFARTQRPGMYPPGKSVALCGARQ
jgi:hypothetical protein